MTPKKSSQITTSVKDDQKHTLIVSVTVPKTLITHAKAHAIEHMAEDVTIKGFRKGKAPLKMVAEALDPQKVTDHVLNHILPDSVIVAIDAHHIRPASMPKVTLTSIAADSDWTWDLSFPVVPEFELDGFEDKIKALLKSSKIWTPADGSTDKKPDEGAKLSQLTEALVSLATFSVSPILIDTEVNQSLSRLLEQLQRLGVSLESYLSSLGKTSEQLRQDYFKSAEDNLKLEFVLAKIASQKHISASDADIDSLLQASSTATGKAEAASEDQRRYLASVITKRKTLDWLMSL